MLCLAIDLYTYVIIGRILMSWFPVEPGGAMASVFSVLYNVTEPVLGPMRRVIPSVGMLDLSPMVVIFGGRILATILASNGLC